MASRRRRNLEVTREALEEWLSDRLHTKDVTVSELTIPKAGFSNETILGRLAWNGGGDERHEVRFVVRIQPSDHQVFLKPDAMFQSRVMRELSRHPGLRVPNVLFDEPDDGVLGSPFFLMELVEGRIPADVPLGWHGSGWTTRLAPDDRSLLYDNALAALVALHAIDWNDGFAFLDKPGSGSALDRYLAHVDEWYTWSAPGHRFGTDVIDAALQYVHEQRPDDGSASVTWGDARMGNMIFADDLSVAAMLDWEGAALGPPGIDVGWWLMFEEYFSQAQGIPRLEGVLGRAGTIARYEELSGRSLAHIEYYEILAGLVFALINSRLADLAITGGQLNESAAAEYVTRVTDMTALWLTGAR
jgi:aminoglycoside phosphotransferase (APT) family kinase protein